MRIREERVEDRDLIRSLHTQAFGTAAEADLVDALRDSGVPCISLVAWENHELRGHILFTPVALSGHADLKLMGLAPMAVMPAYQRRGIGSRLVGAGLERCAARDYDAVVVLGHPDFYPRFGFEPSIHYAITSEYDVPDEAFMIRELRAGVLRDVSGIIRYHPLFAGF
ncbi:MAG TPA: N-acetyltransferase [Gammaproteobacteria bacterium]|jgi:putative acetyltransferase